MDHNTIVAAALGVLEGLTEFIPVSSTGHLLLAGHFLGFDSPARSFEVLIQLGALLAILGLYAARLVQVVRDAPHDPVARRFIGAVLLAFAPAAVIGAMAHGFIKTVLFETPMLVAVMLILGGFVLLWVDRRAATPRYTRAEDIPLSMAFRIGLFQCLAMIPGVSRSGATIVGALLMGADKRSAAEFSFFLAMPTMLGAFSLDLWQIVRRWMRARSTTSPWASSPPFWPPSWWCAGCLVTCPSTDTGCSHGGASSSEALRCWHLHWVCKQC